MNNLFIYSYQLKIYASTSSMYLVRSISASLIVAVFRYVRYTIWQTENISVYILSKSTSTSKDQLLWLL